MAFSVAVTVASARVLLTTTPEPLDVVVEYHGRGLGRWGGLGGPRRRRDSSDLDAADAHAHRFRFARGHRQRDLGQVERRRRGDVSSRRWVVAARALDAST